MRLAYVTSRIARRSDLQRGPIDAEWLVESPHEVVVYADEESVGTAAVRERYSVHIAAKQRVDLGDGRVGTSDRAQAATLAAEHHTEAFDAILYDSDRSIDWSVYEPSLAGVRRGVCVGRGAPAQRALIRTAPDVGQQYARHVWTEYSAIASADFIVSSVPMGAFGLTGFEGPVVTLGGPLPADTSTSSDGTIAVVAMYGDAAVYAGLVGRVRKLVEVGENATMVVIVPDWTIGHESVAQLVGRSVKPEWRFSTVIVTGPGETASEFLETADLVVAATQADLGLTAVRAAASSRQVTSIDGPADQPDPFDSILEWSPRDQVKVGVAAFAPGEVDSIRDLAQAVDYVFLIGDDGDSLADMASGVRLASRDLLVFGAPQPVIGHPDPTKVAPNFLGFASSQFSSIEPLLGDVRSVWELIVWVARLSNSSASRMEVLPAPIGTKTHDLTIDVVPGLPAFTDGRSPVVMMDLSQARRPVAVVPAAVAPQASMQHWAKEHSWADRVRLALPWRYGLLPKAMRERW